ncbi:MULTISPECIES: TolC family protein [unclassified Nitrosospira]|uniref:TolC family protein n=1 Tax=unclassified Nitrosospira TaxID=2609267 RepID=UPI000D45CCF4|nr:MULTISPECIES: TolC family protein [unclassified Nitrosospira]PTR16320.1 outer membrane protein TolC [Nitrosospira sp. Nsp2]WON73684.1 TolC family protein [Nitrosospira sp. Is2]
MIHKQIIAAALTLALLQSQAHGEISSWTGTAAPTRAVPQIPSGASATANSNDFPGLRALIAEALENSPEVQAALREREAARQRISPAEALDDPVLEAGVINAPLASSTFNREDMTMKMIGLSQRLPFPGKRGLRKDVAAKDAEAVEHGYAETVNRVTREIKIAYFDLGLTLELTRLVEKNKSILDEFLHIAEDHYSVGRGNQTDVLKAQTQVSRMTDELLRLARERTTIEAELIRALGRSANMAAPVPEPPLLNDFNDQSLHVESLRAAALAQRPRLLALQSLVARNDKALELARKNYYPDLDVRMSYGQRDNMLDGSRRPDMVSLTVAINLPVWRGNKLEPRELESLATRDQALSIYQAQRNEVGAQLRQQVAAAEQTMKSARLYQDAILPQARLTVESALAAYRVNRVDFLTLLDSQMTVFNYEISLVQAMASYNKTLAEIDLLTGKAPNNHTNNQTGNHSE